MRKLRCILFVALATLLSISDTTSASKSVKGPTSGGPPRTQDLTTGPKDWHSDDRRLLRSDINSPEPYSIDEERSAFFGKLKKTARRIQLRFANMRMRKFMKKMDKMYQGGSTPEKLAELYGSTEKLKLQKVFAQYYKWKQSWKTQGHGVYPRPGTVKRLPTALSSPYHQYALLWRKVKFTRDIFRIDPYIM
ncbi:hypothetical protein PR001_g28372 [Phytophthora rubi]|uniref:RxLR effector protein n=1 Tax=Phytophthora rubi TaxID=129364 RepID=A0A6A3HD61_9STRA|nr:hypothetical protein PR002_g28687 [Phytophthora rubi]KAE8966548.1 hypothetical protein PR001_g28372 [Phytophthora rubi]